MKQQDDRKNRFVPKTAARNLITLCPTYRFSKVDAVLVGETLLTQRVGLADQRTEI
jgi:hypothetical protein